VSYDWDGTTNSGATAGAGPYKVSVVAQNGGTTVTSRNLVWAPVESISNPSSGAPTLSVTGLGSIAVSAVRQIG